MEEEIQKPEITISNGETLKKLQIEEKNSASENKLEHKLLHDKTATFSSERISELRFSQHTATSIMELERETEKVASDRMSELEEKKAKLEEIMYEKEKLSHERKCRLEDELEQQNKEARDCIMMRDKKIQTLEKIIEEMCTRGIDV